MITFLKQNKFGRATFLPLTSINGTAGIRQNEALQEEGVIGLANTLVKVEEIYRGLADHLLGRTVVVKHIDHGVALAKKYKQTLRIVTLEGELINPGGAMTGGAFRNSSNLLSRRREIEEFEKTVEKLKSEMEQMEQEVEHEKEARADYYSKIEAIKQQLQKAYVIQNTAKMNAEQVKAKIDREQANEIEYVDESQKADSTATASGSSGNAGGKPVRNSEREKPKWEDTITNRMLHWSYTPEQKEEVKKALAAGVPKATILTYFYPEVTVEKMSSYRKKQ